MSTPGEKRPVEILLVEDNPGDVVLIREGLRGARASTRVSVATNGEAALDRLRGQGEFAEAPRPDLILLDLNLPRLGGREVLAAIKSDNGLRRIPVVVLTSSQAEPDVAASYDLHANCYVSKPTDLEEFLRVVRGIEQFWLGVARLPGEGRNE
jgi:CheY-like chemotaxis protein